MASITKIQFFVENLIRLFIRNCNLEIILERDLLKIYVDEFEKLHVFDWASKESDGKAANQSSRNENLGMPLVE